MIFLAFDLIVLILAGYWYWKNSEKTAAFFKRLVLVTLGLKMLAAAFFTWSQWYVWHLSRPEFLSLPLSSNLKLFGAFKIFDFLKSIKGGYFIFYSFGHFWLELLLALLVAAGWWFLLKLVAKYKEVTVTSDELLLAWITAVIAGWPGIVLYVPIVFMLMALGMLYFRLRKIDKLVAMGWPVIMSSTIVLVAGTFLVELLGLAVLKV